MATIAVKFGSHNLGTTEDVEQIQVRSGHVVEPVYIPRKNGFLVPAGSLGFGEISMSGKLVSTTYTNLRTARDTFKAAVKGAKQQLTFDDERYIYCQLRDFDWAFITMNTCLFWTATFVADEAKEYSITFQSDSEVSPSSGVAYNMTQNGNATTRAKITITNTSGGSISGFTFENTTTGELFKYVGTLADTKALVVNNFAGTTDTAITVTNDGVDDIANFQGDPITLASGTNALKYTGSTTVTVKTEWHDAWYL